MNDRRVVSARVAGEVLWHLGYKTFGTEGSANVQQALVGLDRPAAVEYAELAATFPEHALALAEARAMRDRGLDWLRDIVLEGRLDDLAELGAQRAAARERVSA